MENQTVIPQNVPVNDTRHFSGTQLILQGPDIKGTKVQLTTGPIQNMAQITCSLGEQCLRLANPSL